MSLASFVGERRRRMTAIAAQVALDPDNARKQLKMYSGARYGRTAATEVARIAAPILATGKKIAPKRRGGRRAGPAAPEPTSENVVPVVFGAGKAIPR